ncbi:hypothetical protein FIBSPDRAFT_960407 [Athelia psychrophila]|uniref:Major facilitator superfamily (MFS) profile domain-containing protein n=1 Tax=Athelia psychrophila TaxID=1759441 RepID=A0A166CFJ8_9AGAM|nr:hypothetical protein FIBSPDRAFT_960407 [Fibularhizoctonia sp. CBS 109695]
MAVPVFIASLKPRPEMRQGRSLWTCLKEVTLMQKFGSNLRKLRISLSGVPPYPPPPPANARAQLARMVLRHHRLLLRLSLSVTNLQESFGKSAYTITTSITLTLLFRSIGAVVFGGLSASSALENLPVELRGLVYDVLQQGYAAGYLIAAVIYLHFVPEQSQGWRTLFRTGAGISMFPACLRACLPKSEVFQRAKEIERLRGSTTGKKTKVFIRRRGTC